MRIYVNAKDAKLFIPVPNFLLYGRLGACAIAVAMRQNSGEEFRRDYKNIRAMQKALKKCIRTHPRLPLVDVESADGDKVKIVL